MHTELEKIAYCFRSAIEEAINNDEQGTFFYKFPTGQCGHTTDMLIQYLLELGYKHIYYVNGTYYGEEWDDRWSHTWLEIDDIVVDITGDQFRYNLKPLKHDAPVYVGPKDEWYMLFDTEHGSCHEQCGIDKSWTNYDELMRWYEIIKKYL